MSVSVSVSPMNQMLFVVHIRFAFGVIFFVFGFLLRHFKPDLSRLIRTVFFTTTLRCVALIEIPFIFSPAILFRLKINSLRFVCLLFLQICCCWCCCCFFCGAFNQTGDSKTKIYHKNNNSNNK